MLEFEVRIHLILELLRACIPKFEILASIWTEITSELVKLTNHRILVTLTGEDRMNLIPKLNIHLSPESLRVLRFSKIPNFELECSIITQNY